MHDHFNDKGWGCAYRSLQTLVSWFKLQHYRPDLNIPTHLQIQQLLVEMQDKERHFIGSTEWIGAFEVSLVLRKLIEVECRILSVRSGADLRDKGHELAHHFDTHGTPVMIGGGVLAYTLLGVEVDEQTGNTRFLILDPHYTGSDDLTTITSKGWCGWKDSKIFLPEAFYNLCMPLRPAIGV